MVAPRGLGDFSTLLEGGVGEVDVVFFFHYELFNYFFNLLNFYPVTRFLVTALLCLVTPPRYFPALI